MKEIKLIHSVPKEDREKEDRIYFKLKKRGEKFYKKYSDKKIIKIR